MQCIALLLAVLAAWVQFPLSALSSCNIQMIFLPLWSKLVGKNNTRHNNWKGMKFPECRERKSERKILAAPSIDEHIVRARNGRKNTCTSFYNLLRMQCSNCLTSLGSNREGDNRSKEIKKRSLLTL